MRELDGVRPRGGLCEGGQGGGGCAETVCFSRCLDVERLLLSLQMFAMFIAAEAGDPTASLLSFLLALQPGVSAGPQLEEARGGGAQEASGSLPRLCVPNPYPALQASQNTRAHKKKNTSRFFISESKHLGHGGLEVMGKEETIRLIRQAHTSSAEIKQKSLGAGPPG